FAVHLYDAAVHFHQLPYQGQADAQPAARALERAVGLHEQLEDLARLRLVEADAAVADTDVDLVADAGLEHDPAARVRVLRGVVQQVGEHLRQPYRVRLQRHRRLRDVQRELVPALFQLRPRGLDGGGEHVLER